MFVLEKESGEVIALTAGGVETRISVSETENGRFILTIDAPPEATVQNIEPQTGKHSMGKVLRDNYRQELLMF